MGVTISLLLTLIAWSAENIRNGSQSPLSREEPREQLPPPSPPPPPAPQSIAVQQLSLQSIGEKLKTSQHSVPFSHDSAQWAHDEHTEIMGILESIRVEFSKSDNPWILRVSRNIPKVYPVSGRWTI